METKDLILRKAEFEDWKPMYHNVWSRAETAKYMAWRITDSEEAAKERIQRTIAYQSTHDAWVVCEKKSGIPMEYCSFLGGETFIYSTRKDNAASKGLARSCDFVYRCSKNRTDLRNGEPYELEIYSRELS